MKRRSRKSPTRSEIALVATTALTSATMLFACLVVPFPAAAHPLRASAAPVATAGSARDGAASRPGPPHILAHLAGASAGERSTSLAVAARAFPGYIEAAGPVATGSPAWTPGEPRGCPLARGQPRADALM